MAVKLHSLSCSFTFPSHRRRHADLNDSEVGALEQIGEGSVVAASARIPLSWLRQIHLIR
jgi:hypothetical protein